MLFFTQLCVTEFNSGETRHIVPQFLACKKKGGKGELEFRTDVGIGFHVNIYLRNYKFCL
jgi:hypothetical protein